MNVASCSCSRTFDHAAWDRLALVGGMDANDPEAPTTILELRNCFCGSTIALARTASAPTQKSRKAAVNLLNLEAKRQRERR